MSDKSKDGKTLGKVIQIDESQIQAHLDQKVRQTVEETLVSVRRSTSSQEL